MILCEDQTLVSRGGIDCIWSGTRQRATTSWGNGSGRGPACTKIFSRFKPKNSGILLFTRQLATNAPNGERGRYIASSSDRGMKHLGVILDIHVVHLYLLSESRCI